NRFRRHRALLNNRSNRFECFDRRFKVEVALTIARNASFRSRLNTKHATRLSNWDDGAPERRFGCFQFERDLSRAATQSWHNLHFFGSRSCILHSFEPRTGRWCGATETWEMDSTATNFENDDPANDPNAGQN